jgi:hypothetical protein
MPDARRPGLDCRKGPVPAGSVSSPIESEEAAVTAPARWYHLQGERQLGPLELDTMRRLVMAGTVGPDTYVWSDGMDEWLPAREVPALVPPEQVREQVPDWR